VTSIDIDAALRELDELSLAEYGVPLVEVVEEPDRLRRLTGIMIKKPFGTPHPIAGHGTMTGARRYWDWDSSKLAHPDDPSSPEYLMLDELRAFVGFPPGRQGLKDLAGHAENERGLFKVTAAWLQDKLRGQKSKSLREYYGAAESKKASALLDLADMLANFALTPVYAALLPAGGFVVPILLLAAKHGYAAVFESDTVPDSEN
jgi:hypothetical protein